MPADKLAGLAAAFAFAAILGFAAVVAGLAAALPFAAIHAFAVMFGRSGLRRLSAGIVVRLAAGHGHGSSHQSRHGCSDD